MTPLELLGVALVAAGILALVAGLVWAGWPR
jgi:hypothetical protein